ncbi:hypothetical protein ACWCOW_03455 [Streptomyces sp. NPDC001939]|uniref:hypothetical protein n=1 Tax=Streptomyces sp. NPDC056240 TaxID=3345759 RepID=UPI0035D5C917
MRGDTFAPRATELSVDEYGFGVSPTTYGSGGGGLDAWPGGESRAHQYHRGRRPEDSERIDVDEDPHYPSVDLPVPAGHPGPDGEVETSSQQLARAFVRWQESRR